MLEQPEQQHFRPDRLDLFWRFVFERQTIWQRRYVQQTPPPWSDDPIMQTQRFTNIYRELDPGTQYAINYILESDNPRPDKVFNIMLYRLIGRSETHATLGFQSLASFEAALLEAALKDIRDVQKKSPFTAAYMVSGYVQMGSRDKVENVSRLFGKLHSTFDDFYARLQACSDSAQVYAVLHTASGFGNFLSYQVLVDLLYPLKAYDDHPLLPYSHDDWASAGPGAKRGIAVLLKEDIKANQLAVMHWLRHNQRSEFERLGLNFPYLQDAQNQPLEISLANIQNCLCEYHKYVKIKEGTGRGRRKFRPPDNASAVQLSLFNIGTDSEEAP